MTSRLGTGKSLTFFWQCNTFIFCPPERLEQSNLHPIPKSYLASYYYDHSEPIQLFHYGTILYVTLNTNRFMVNWLPTGLYFQRDLLFCVRALLHIAQVRHFTAFSKPIKEQGKSLGKSVLIFSLNSFSGKKFVVYYSHVSSIYCNTLTRTESELRKLANIFRSGATQLSSNQSSI